MDEEKTNIGLLVLPHAYLAWVKDLVETEAKYLSRIDVLLHHNLLSEISYYIPLGGCFEHVRWYTKRKMIDLNRKPDNVHVHLIDTLYFVPDGKNLRLGDKLVKKYERHIQKQRLEFDIIHAHFTYPQGYVAVKLGEKLKIPTVVTAHGHDVYEMPFRSKKWGDIIKFVWDSADYIITVSHKNKTIIENLTNSKDTIVIPNGYNSSAFKYIPKDVARKVLNLSLDKKILLNVGNLYPIKGHYYLLYAFARVLECQNDAMLIIAGEGSYGKNLRQLSKKLGINKHVLFVGARPHKELPFWMNAADLFVLPSLSEGNPTVMFEALGVGLPFIGTKVGGIPEIITSEDYGLLCEPANPEDLAEKILIALEKKWDREKIRKYAEQFTWDNIAKQVLDVYIKVIESAKR